MARPIVRCWGSDDPQLAAYHDKEWGRPAHDDRVLFEHLALDGFQAGLSWRTILHKREAFREAFVGFDPERVARFGRREVQRLQWVYCEMRMTYRRYRRETRRPAIPELRNAVLAFRRGPSLTSLVDVATFLDDRQLLAW